jgi:hypothetical protein
MKRIFNYGLFVAVTTFIPLCSMEKIGWDCFDVYAVAVLMKEAKNRKSVFQDDIVDIFEIWDSRPVFQENNVEAAAEVENVVKSNKVEHVDDNKAVKRKQAIINQPIVESKKKQRITLNRHQYSLCSFCNTICLNDYQLKVHCKDKHGIEIPKDYPCIAPECSQSFVNERQLDLHLNKCHLKERLVFCDTCKESYLSIASLRGHERYSGHTKKTFKKSDKNP